MKYFSIILLASCVLAAPILQRSPIGGSTMEPGTEITDTTDQVKAVETALDGSVKPGDIVTTKTHDSSSTIQNAAHSKRDGLTDTSDTGAKVNSVTEKASDIEDVVAPGDTANELVAEIQATVDTATATRRHVPTELDLEGTLGEATQNPPSLTEGDASPAEGISQ